MAMKKLDIPLSAFNLNRGKILESSQNGTVFLCPPQGLELTAKGCCGAPVGGVSFEGMKYLTIEVECLEEHSAAFDFCLWEQQTQGEFDMRIMFGILPNVMTPVPIELKNLESQEIFPERTKGRLKMGVFGKPVDWRLVDRVALVSLPLDHEHQICIRSIYLSDELPEISFEPRPLMDELGQWMPKEWQGKTKNREECNTYLHQLLHEAEAFDGKYKNPDWDCWGGCKNLCSLEKTGWFHTQMVDGRWWLADPDGNAFFSTGIDCVRTGNDTRVDIMEDFFSWLPPSDGEYEDAWENKRKYPIVNFGVSNLIAAFGAENWWECWAKIVKKYLIEHGFNTIGNWSEKKFIDFSKMPYVLPLDEYSPVGFPSTSRLVFRDFPDVFSSEFEKNSILFGNTLAEFSNERAMIGYFMRNEPAWAFIYELCIAEELLANPNPLDSKLELIRRLKEKYTDIAALNQAWGISLASFDHLLMPINHACKLSTAAKADLIEFSEIMIERYVSLPAKKCREVDPNHLNLGMRYAYITDKSLLAGYENFDVFSINSYQINPYEQIEAVGKLLDKPVMIGEFHHGALDRGLTAMGIRAVANQEERATAYRYYVEQGAKSRYFLGGHYFLLNDQSSLGRFDGENYQIGLLDVCMHKYQEISKAALKCHYEIYDVAAGRKPTFETAPIEVPTIHY